MTAVLCWAGDTCFSSAGQGVSPIVFPVPGDTVFSRFRSQQSFCLYGAGFSFIWKDLFERSTRV